jgi:hypothetical protein
VGAVRRWGADGYCGSGCRREHRVDPRWAVTVDPRTRPMTLGADDLSEPWW